MADRLLAETESQASPQEDWLQKDLPISPACGRHIIRQRLAQLATRTLLTGADAVWLSHQLTARHYAAGEVVLKEGTRGDCLGLLRSGQLAVYSSVSFRSTPIALLLPGSVFGEAMLTDGQPSDSTFCATVDAEVLFLRRADFLAVVRQRQPQPVGVVSRQLRRLFVTILTFLVISALLALKPTRQAIALVPYSTGLWLGQRGYTDWAESTWVFTERLTPDWPAPHLSLGNLYFRKRQFDRAKVELERALTLTPHLPEAYNNLGLVYAAQGDYATAIDAFQQALALEPGQAAVEGNLAFSLQMVGQRDEALQHYALARLLDAPQPVLLTNEAIAHYEAGNLAAAESAARQALDLGDASAPAYTVLGAVDLAQQRALEAIPSLEEAARLDPFYAPAHFYLGLAYKSLDRPVLAAAALERALALTPEPLTQREARRHLSELDGRYGIDADR